MNASVTGSTVLFTGVAAGIVTVTVTATDTGNLTATQTFTLHSERTEPSTHYNRHDSCANGEYRWQLLLQ